MSQHDFKGAKTMNTKEFVAMQLAKPFKERRIPDSLYIRKNTFRITLLELSAGQAPQQAGFCFGNNFMYENFTRYIGALYMLYPNIVITEGECREYS